MFAPPPVRAASLALILSAVAACGVVEVSVGSGADAEVTVEQEVIEPELEVIGPELEVIGPEQEVIGPELEVIETELEVIETEPEVSGSAPQPEVAPETVETEVSGPAEVEVGPVDDTDGGPARALWVWHEVELEDHLALLDQHDIDRVYIDAYDELLDDPVSLATYTSTLSEHDVAAEFLFGPPGHWALAENHHLLLDRVEDLVDAVSEASGPAFVAVHLDVEPHTIDLWDEDQAAVGAQLLALYEEVVALVEGTGIEVVADLPFWYDGVMVPTPTGDRPLSEAAMDVLDRVVVMAYRDKGTGSDSIASLSAEELAYGGAIGKPVVIGVETRCDLEPEKITFCEEGLAAMEAALAEVTAEYADSPAFGGFAIHHHDTLAELAP